MKLQIGNALTKVENARPEEAAAVRAALAYEKRDFRNGKWYSETKSMYDGRSKHFLTGLIVQVIQHCRAHNIHFTASDNRQPLQAPGVVAPLEGIAFGQGDYDYQMKAVIAALEKRRGVLKLATGAGKTECAVAISKTLQQPTLFLTHRVNLLYQTAERFALRWPELQTYDQIGIIGDSQYRPNFVTFSTVQTLDSFLKKKMTRKEVVDDLTKFRVVIIDEAHRAGARQFVKVAKLLHNADYRIGLSATPFIKTPYENLCLQGITGGVLHEVSASELIRKGVLARPFFKFLPVYEPNMPAKKFKHWLDVYEHGIVKNQKRNEMVVSAVSKLVDMGKKPLAIVQQIEHMEILERMLIAAGVKPKVASGNMGARERAKTLKQLGRGGIDTIVCTNIFDEGIDVKEVGGVVMAAGTKSAPAFMQRTGRAIRKKSEDNNAVVIDFMDNQHWMLKKHSQQRLELVEKEAEFMLLR